MQVFAVIAPEGNDALDRAVKAAFPGNYFIIAPGQYLVAAPGLVLREIGERIGDKGQVGRLMVLPFDKHWGWHRTELWEWAQARAQA